MSYAQYRLPQVLHYGRGSLAELGNQASEFGKRALLISDRNLERSGKVNLCIDDLRSSGLTVATYLDVNSEPTDLHVAEALQVLKENQCDVIIALGGGSCIDAAKAVSVIASGEQINDLGDLQQAIADKPIPLIAIPTTAGTGSEVTNVSVIIHSKDDVKIMIKHNALMPAAAIIDSTLTLSVPPLVTASTGIDALCHALEAYISRKAQPLTDHLALGAIELIVRNIRSVYQDGRNEEARDHMMLASMMAGTAFSNASVTLVHGMSRPIGALFHVPHGMSNAMLLPVVMKFTRDSATSRLARIGTLFRPDANGLSEEELADLAVLEIKQLCRDLQIPNLKTWGVNQAHFDQMTAKMATDALASGSPANNPRVPTHEEISHLYQECYNYDFSDI